MYFIQPNRSRALWTAWVLATAVALAAFGASNAARGDEPKPPVKNEDKLHKLLQAHLDAAKTVYELRIEQYTAGRLDLDQILAAEKQVFAAELELLDKKDERVSACERNLERCTEAKKLAVTRVEAGLGSPGDAAEAEYERLDAEILLEREKAK